MVSAAAKRTRLRELWLHLERCSKLQPEDFRVILAEIAILKNLEKLTLFLLGTKIGNGSLEVLAKNL